MLRHARDVQAMQFLSIVQPARLSAASRYSLSRSFFTPAFFVVALLMIVKSVMYRRPANDRSLPHLHFTIGRVA